MCVGSAHLHDRLKPTPDLGGYRTIRVDEGMRTVHRGDDQGATRSQPAADLTERGHRIGEVLHGEVRERDVEAGGSKASASTHRSATRNSSSHASGGAGSWMSTPENRSRRERNCLRCDTTAAGVEGHGARRRQGRVEPGVDDLRGGRLQPQARPDGEPPWAVATCVARSGRSGVRGRRRRASSRRRVRLAVSSQRSASMAALQPSAAAVTAWR